MPHAWPFTALSAAGRRRCATTDDRGIVSAIDAFVDRAPIDWVALRDRARGEQNRTLIEALQSLDRLRAATRTAGPARESPPGRLLIWLVIGCASLAIGTGVIVALPPVAADAGIKTLLQLLLALAFAAGALLVGVAGARDERRVFFLGFLLCVGTSFARAAVTALPVDAPSWMRALWLDGLAPACLWQFALDFPRVERFARFDQIARRFALLVWACGVTAVAANLSVIAGLVSEAEVFSLLPNHAGSMFWRGYSVATILAVAAIFIRARRAPRHEQRKVVRLAASLAAGTGPFLILAMARTAVPGFENWFLHTAPALRLTLDGLVVVSLLATPIMASTAVVLDRPFDRQPRLAHAGRRLLQRAAVWSFARHRRQLTAALRGLREARGPRRVSSVAARAIADALDAPIAHVLIPDGNVFVDCLGSTLTMPDEAALIALLRASPRALDLNVGSALHDMLPERELQWLATAGIQVAVPIVTRDGTLGGIVVAGSRAGALNLARRDLWFAEAVAAAASAAWTHEQRDRAAVVSADAAWECPRCGIVQETAPMACGCDIAAPALAALPSRLGTTFAVRRRLGSGGMGVAYLARDLRLDRDVALKTLPSIAAGAVDRLRREARAMAALNHGALATIYGLEIWRDVPVLVCEYCPGGTLAQRLAAGTAMSPVDTIQLGIRLARGLDYMHSLGLMHGDIKPANIGLTSRGEAKLLDFGLSRLAVSDSDDGLWQAVGGTVGYLSPEVLRGGLPQPSLDLWSLAVVLLECLVGRNPLVRDSDMSTRRAIDAADAAALTAPVWTLHPPLAAILQRALGPSSARFASAAAIAAALELLAPRRPDQAQPE